MCIHNRGSNLHEHVIFLFRDVSGFRIVGCPKCISDKKYDRNAFIFNSVFVFDSTTDTSPYEPIIQKLGDAFKTYEVGTC